MLKYVFVILLFGLFGCWLYNIYSKVQCTVVQYSTNKQVMGGSSIQLCCSDCECSVMNSFDRISFASPAAHNPALWLFDVHHQCSHPIKWVSVSVWYSLDHSSFTNGDSCFVFVCCFFFSWLWCAVLVCAVLGSCSPRHPQRCSLLWKWVCRQTKTGANSGEGQACLTRKEPAVQLGVILW